MLKRILAIIMLFAAVKVFGQYSRSEVLLYYAPWVLESAELTCKVVAIKDAEGKFMNHLKIMRLKEKADEIIYSDSTYEWITALFPQSQLNGNLVAVWGGGEQYTVKAYNYEGGKVREVLSKSSASFPEILMGAGKTGPAICVTAASGKHLSKGSKANPVKIKYVWSGTQYIEGKKAIKKDKDK